MNKLAWLWNTHGYASFDEIFADLKKGGFTGIVVKARDGNRWQSDNGMGGNLGTPLDSLRGAEIWATNFRDEEFSFHITANLFGDNTTWRDEATVLGALGAYADSIHLDVEPSSFGGGVARHFSPTWENFRPMVELIIEKTTAPLVISVPSQDHAISMEDGSFNKVPLKKHIDLFDAVAPQLYWPTFGMSSITVLAQASGHSRGTIHNFAQYGIDIHPYFEMNSSNESINVATNWMRGRGINDFTVFRLQHPQGGLDRWSSAIIPTPPPPPISPGVTEEIQTVRNALSAIDNTLLNIIKKLESK